MRGGITYYLTSSLALAFSSKGHSYRRTFFSKFSTKIHPVPPCTFTFSSSYVTSILYCFAARAHLWIYVLLLPATGRPGTSFFFLAGPCPLHEIALSTFSSSPFGRTMAFKFLSLRLTPLELQSGFGGKALKFQVICSQLSPKRDCSPKRVNPLYIS